MNALYIRAYVHTYSMYVRVYLLRMYTYVYMLLEFFIMYRYIRMYVIRVLYHVQISTIASMLRRMIGDTAIWLLLRYVCTHVVGHP